jgi:outer membrane protein OmpA-like peptidoglycan-associated protein
MASAHASSDLASSLTDLMTSLAVIFVLLLVASMNNMQQKTKQTVNTILLKLQAELQQYAVRGVEVRNDPKDPLGLLVLVPEGLLQFNLNDATIPEHGIEFLKEFSPKLASIACSVLFRDEISSIVIEGHTDASGDEEKTNLPLSQKRSMSVLTETLQALKTNAPEQSDDLRSCFLKFVSASGRGSQDPLSSVDPKTNRRVVFKIRVRSLEQRQILPLHNLGFSPR